MQLIASNAHQRKAPSAGGNALVKLQMSKYLQEI